MDKSEWIRSLSTTRVNGSWVIRSISTCFLTNRSDDECFDWMASWCRLGGLDVLSDASDLPWMTYHLPKLDHIYSYFPPETNGNAGSLNDETLLTFDRWCFGILLWEVFNGMSIRNSDQLMDYSRIPKVWCTFFIVLKSPNALTRWFH